MTIFGAPARDIAVWAYSPTDGMFGSYATTTGVDGTYTIVAPPGTYRVVFMRPLGLSPVWFLGASSRESATPVVTTAGSITTGIDQVLPGF